MVLHAGNEDGGASGLTVGAGGNIYGGVNLHSAAIDGGCRQVTTSAHLFSAASHHTNPGWLEMDRSRNLEPAGIGMGVGPWGAPVARATFHVINE